MNLIMALKNKYNNVPIHFVGIGGCGMSALALFFHQLGADVSGSDNYESIYFRSLEQAGICVHVGHHADHVRGRQIVVVSSAISESNEEMIMARQLGVRIIHRSGLLAEIAFHHKAITVSGAHGKTTTATLLAHVLSCCNFFPSYIIGGLPKPPMKHAFFGGNDLLIMEADESDRSLLKYVSELAIVTNIDLDHTYDGGYTCKEDVARVIGRMASKARQAFISDQASKYLQLENSITVQYRTVDANGSYLLNGKPFQAILPDEGSIQNCAMVSAVAMSLGCHHEEINKALASFAGVNRRFDVIGKISTGADVVLDYSHHPNEIRTVIEAARRKYSGRIMVIFQPHLYSRTIRFRHDFADALSLADSSYITEIFASRESVNDWPGVDSSLIIEYADTSRVMPIGNVEDIIGKIKDSTSKHDCILVLGAGDIYELGYVLVSR